MTGKYLSYLLWIEGVFMLPAAGVGFLYQDMGGVAALLISSALCLLAGGILWLVCHKAEGSLYAREGFVVAGLGWVLISLFGALPFVISGEIPHFIDAVFEVVSGFTTTGSSILVDVEAMSHGLLFWRSFTHWLGGIGVLAFLLAIVRAKRGAGFTIHLLRAETPGPQVGKVLPKTRQSVRYLFVVYIGLSIINLLFLLVGGMPVFDAFCTMFGTAGTGGFGIKVDSMASYSPYLQTVTTIFMALFGVNFTLYIFMLRREWRGALWDEELRLYVGIMLGSIALITLSLLGANYGSVGFDIHHAAFTVSSIMTTTGFATVDFDLWPEFTRSLLLILMVFGAMAGSTGGGFKMARLLIVVKSMRASLHRLMHPRSVKAVRVNGRPLDKDVISGTLIFLCVYCAIAIISFLLISIDNFSVDTNLSAMLACFNNIGPGLGAVGPTANFSIYSYFSKIVLTLDMLLGRLEIFPILFLFSPNTWRRKT